MHVLLFRFENVVIQLLLECLQLGLVSYLAGGANAASRVWGAEVGVKAGAAAAG